MQVGKSAHGGSAGLRITVVICTFNRARSLADCLVSLQRQSYANFEVVVVVGPCTDATRAVVHRHGRRIKVVECPERNLSVSRNRGIAAAAGDVVAFIDDDAVAHPRWLEKLAMPYADAAVGGAGGFTIDNTGTRFQCRYTVCDRTGNAVLLDHFDPAARLSAAGLWHFPSLLGTNSSFRRLLLEDIGGFDEQFEYMLDETDVCLRIVDQGRMVVTVPDALVFHRYAESHLRDHRRIARSLLAPSRSKAHFLYKHARGRLMDAELAATLDRFRADLRFSNRWHIDRNLLPAGQFVRLNRELDEGLRQGIASGANATQRPAWQPSPPQRFLPLRERTAEKLAIALVSQGFPPHDTSGIARWTHELAHALSARGHRVHVITAGNALRQIDYDGGVWIHTVPRHSGEADSAPVVVPDSIAARGRAVLAEARLIREQFGLDILSAPIWDVEGLFCAAHLGIPVVTSLHTAYRMVLPMKRKWQTDLPFRFHHVERVIDAETWLLRKSALLLANSHEICREMTALYGVPVGGPGTAVVPHGVAARPASSEAGPAAADNGPAVAGSCRVLYVGRIEARKGLDLLLQAMLPLFDEAPLMELDVVGAPVPEEAEFTAEISELRERLTETGHAERACFHGYVDDTMLQQFYAACDVFVVPSRFESFGLIAIEAMRFGKPIIAADVGGLAEIVEHGCGGLKVQCESVPALRDALRTLIADPALRQRMGEQAVARFTARYTCETMAAQVEQAFQSVLGASHDAGEAAMLATPIAGVV